MSLDLFLRVLALCVALAGVETLHGIARTVLLAPRIGKARAVQLSVVSGTLLAVCSCTVLPLFAGIYRMGAGIGPATAASSTGSRLAAKSARDSLTRTSGWTPSPSAAVPLALW